MVVDKPQMLVSWQTILLNSFGMIITLLILLVSIANGLPFPESSAMFLTIFATPPFLIVLPIITVLLVGFSFLKSPRGYLKTVFSDAVLVVPVLISVSLILKTFLNEGIMQIFIFEVYVLPAVLVVIVGIYLNHKMFQKTEQEWIAKKSK